MATAFGLFGTTQADLTASGFFRWFNLVDETELGPAAPTAEAPGETVYRPSGDAFRRLVFFKSQSDPARTLKRLELYVARAFINDDRQSPFARDIAKSFLEAIEQPVPPQLHPVIADIWSRDPRAVVFTRASPPQLPEAPTEGYVIFSTPTQQAWSCKLAYVDLTLQNIFGTESCMESTGDPSAFRLRADLI